MKHLEDRNWIWHMAERLENRSWLKRVLSLAPEPELPRSKALERILDMQKTLPMLWQRLEELGIQRIRSINILGSYIWGREPNDIDLFIVTEGDRPREVCKPIQIAGFERPIHIRVVGWHTVQRALAGQDVKDLKTTWLEAMILYGIAVPMAGDDVFAGSPPPPAANLRVLADHFRGGAAIWSNRAHLEPERRESKGNRWQLEAAAIELAIEEMEVGKGSKGKPFTSDLTY